MTRYFINSLCKIAFIITISGCAMLSEKQIGHITSTPSGANVYFYEDITDQILEIGKTPIDAYCKQGLWTTYLVVEKKGYEKEKIRLPKSGPFNYHFKLKRDFSTERVSPPKSLF